ncbi:MAG: tetratricopeptide repeat protein [Chthoniobacteraceae bacterium]
MKTPRRLFLTALICAACGFPAVHAQSPRFRIGPSADIQEEGKKKVSDEAQATSKAAMAALEKGDSAGAKKLFQKVLALAPANAPTLINLGLIEYRQKRYADAETLLKSAVKSAPESGLPWLVLGVLQYEQNKLDAAFASLAMSVYLDPKDARTHHYLGIVVGSKGWYSAAEDEMRKAIEIEPGYAEAHYNLAVFYLERKPPSIELARRHYYKSLDLGGAPDADLEKKIEAR